MSGVLRLFACLGLIALLGAAQPALAQSQFGAKPKAKQEEGVPQPFMRPAAPKPAAVAPPVLPIPSTATSSMPDSTPRMGGLQSSARGGGQCRTSCAQTYYRCLSGDDMSSCGGYWARCLSSCPKTTSEF